MDTGNFDQVKLDAMLEEHFIRGERNAYNYILMKCLQGLNYESDGGIAWYIEREMAIASLRGLCDYYGDNDWDENLNLSDIIEKHLARYLYENFKKIEKDF